MKMSDMSSNIVFSIADNFVAHRAFVFNIFVNPLMSFERALIKKPLGALGALDERFVLRVNRLVELQRCHPFEFLFATGAFVFVFV